MSGHNESILCIHYYFPPLDSSAVIRNYKFTTEFSSRFDKVYVLTSDNYQRFPQLKLPLNQNILVEDITTFDYRSVMSWRKKTDSHIKMEKKQGKFYSILLKIQKSFPFNLLLAEGNLIYIINAYLKAVKLIKKHNISTIYSSFGPYADHYVAYLLKKKFPTIRWIADFRDLQIEPIYKNVIWKRLQRNIEKQILAKADVISTISEGLAKYLESYGNDVRAIPRGVEIRDPKTQFDKFTIAYTGSLYFDYRDPKPLFQAIRQLIDSNQMDSSQLNLVYAGRDGAQFESWIKSYGLEDSFKNYGLVSREKAQEIQDRSQINLLLTSSSNELSGVLTGKFFEYFEALNPILCLINGPYDPEFENIFRKLNAGVVTYSSDEENKKMKSFLLEKYEQFIHENIVTSTINQDILTSDYSWEAQTDKLLQII